MTEQDDSASDVVGRRIGNYEATKLLGKGSMGEVYQAAHPILDKQVAIKVLSEELSSFPELVSRFKREARAIARIKHDAIVQAFDFGTLEDGRQYYVMELLKGSNLAVYMTAKGPLPWDETLAIALPLLEGLAAAHDAGFIHRDIKPDNLFLTRLEDGTLYPKIIDFGIAKLRNPDEQADSVVTRIDAVMGTPLYMSPEQAPGSTEEVGAWSDIYSAAATIYHMVAGKPPFYSDNPLELMLMHSWQPPPPVYEHRPDLSLEISDAIMKALAKKPTDRYDSMQSFADALRAVAKGKPAEADAAAAEADAPEPEPKGDADAEADPPAKKPRKTAEAAAVVATINEVKEPAQVPDADDGADTDEAPDTESKPEDEPEEEEEISLEALAANHDSHKALTSLSGAASEKVISAPRSTGTYFAVEKKSRLPYIIAGVVAGLIVAGLIVFFATRGGGPPAAKPLTFRQLSSSTRHTCGLHRTDGSVWCWGRNNYGQLGTGDREATNRPKRVTGLGKMQAVVAGGRHSCGLAADGTVWCWGKNTRGQLGDGSVKDSPRPVQVAGLKGVRALDVGADHSCAVAGDGRLWCWGDNRSAQLGRAAGGHQATPVLVDGLKDVQSVTLGGFHSCALTQGGRVRCWGKNDVGQLGVGDTKLRATPTEVTGLDPVARITAGGAHTCALTVKGGLRCWGNNASGQLGDGTTRLRFAPVKVVGLTGVSQVSAGGGYLGGHTCAVQTDGTALCWGNNLAGQLGHSQPADTHQRPTPLTRLGKVAALEASGRHTCALERAGKVRCWGRNTDGQLGDGSTTDRPRPTPIKP